MTKRLTDKELHHALKAAERAHREAQRKYADATTRTKRRAYVAAVRAEVEVRLIELRQTARRAKAALAVLRRLK